MAYPGSGKTFQRGAAIALVILPLVLAAWSLSDYLGKVSSKQGATFESVALFVATLLLTAFTYDALKTILTLNAGDFSKFWESIKNLILCIIGYVVCVAVLAVIPSKMDYFDAIVAVGFFVATLADRKSTRLNSSHVA